MRYVGIYHDTFGYAHTVDGATISSAKKKAQKLQNNLCAQGEIEVMDKKTKEMVSEREK